MIKLIIGGSCSGKSAYAEGIVARNNKSSRYYLATMAASDEESKKRIVRHQKARAGLDFKTLEYAIDVSKAAGEIAEDSVVLVECVSNLVANEMFMPNARHYLYDSECKEATYVCLLADKIVSDIITLAAKRADLIIVSNNIFEDGNHYDEDTILYIDILGMVNQKLATLANEVTEVVAGLPVIIKK